MLINFKIKNFRSYKDEVVFSMEAESSKLKPQNFVEIELPNNQTRLLKLAMIFGSNASGKTNVIRAFYNLVNYITRKPQVNTKIWMYEPFLFDNISSKENTEFELNFIGPDSIKYSYKIIFNQSRIENEILNYYPSGKIANVFTRTSADENSNIHTGILGLNFGKKEIKVFNNQLLMSKFGDDEPIEQLTNIFLYFKKIEVINAVNTNHTSFIKNQMDEVAYSNKLLFKKLNALIKFADTKLKGFAVHTNAQDKNSGNLKGLKDKTNTSSYMVYGLHPLYEGSVDTGENYTLPFDNESTGTQVLYALGGKILLTIENGGILIVDELDTSLHPFLTRMIILMFQSEKLNPKNAQLIFTTHDMTLLDRELIRKDQVWIAEKNQMGISEVFSLQDFDGVREETPFDKWYLAGKFGGLPEMKSIDSMFDESVN
jgi:AAA15 family ATPase/GTPase